MADIDVNNIFTRMVDLLADVSKTVRVVSVSQQLFDARSDAERETLALALNRMVGEGSTPLKQSEGNSFLR